jgi:Cdc6-like AAA superfamily ATPase
MSTENRTVFDRSDGFVAKVVAHPLLTTVFDEVRAITRNPAGTSLVLEVGPTGAGKTTMITRLVRELREEAGSEMSQKPGMIPVIVVEARSPEEGMFHWGDFYLRFLKAASEPMIEHKSLEGIDTESRKAQKLTGTVSALRRAVESCIRHRETKVIIIDEAQHLTKVPNARRMHDQMDAIKSLASLSDALFVMVGTYELLPLLNRSGQLARRTRCIHFPRYRLDRPEDRSVLRNIIAAFQEAMPFAKSTDLQQHFEYLYFGTLGCIGMLKNWLRRAVVHALERNKDSLELNDLEATVLSNDSLLQIFREIQDGEEHLERNARCGDELRRMLGLAAAASSVGEANGAESGRRRLVGERKPIRDPVGVKG